MRKLYTLLMASVLLLGGASCNHEWEDELYDHSVSFVKNGLTDIHIRYNSDGKVTYRLPLVVSGSLKNEANISVNVALDPDTLAEANFQEFGSREDLFYLPLDEKFYDMPSTVDIRAGEDEGMLDIDFNLDGIDMSRNYVLPLSIVEGGGYVPNYRKYFRKALLNVIPYNDYSGQYSATNALIDDGSGSPVTVSSRQTQVVDANKIFFYAGMTQEELKERADYKVIVEFIPQSEENKDEGTIKLSAPNPEINFQDKGEGTYLVTRVMDEVTPYLEHIYVTVNLEYQYDELIYKNVPEEGVGENFDRLTYKVSGSMMMERKRNTLIPDEDQAWEW